MKSKDIVLFLGAGFSCDAGLPLMAQFGQESENQRAGLLEEVKYNKPSVKIFLEAGEAFRNVQSMCVQINEHVNIDKNNLEAVFCFIEALKEAGEEGIQLGRKEWPIDELRKKISLWLWKIYQQCPPLNKRKKIEPKPYNDFFNFIKEKKLFSRITVVTTNYDLIVEYFARQHKIPIYYPLEQFESLFVHGENPSYLSSFNQDNNAMIVCKLHGSINYFKARQAEEDLDGRLFVADRTTLNKNKIGGSIIPRNSFEIFALDWFSEKTNDKFVPVFIPPTFAKLRQSNWLRNIWRTAFRALRDAKYVIFIGYSFPPSDGFMKSLFQGGYAYRARGTPRPIIYVIDNDCMVLLRYEELFKDNNIVLNKKYFKDACAELIEWLQAIV